MAGLTSDQIQALLGQTRTKGVYIARLNEFLASGEQGVCAHDDYMELKDKAASTVKQGFENAKNGKNAAEGADQVKVITNEDKVYLINLGAAQVEAPVEA